MAWQQSGAVGVGLTLAMLGSEARMCLSMAGLAHSSLLESKIEVFYVHSECQ